jgi:catechol 2,3-dioxygenase-like lactoylglutathione lyase family enzyme
MTHKSTQTSSHRPPAHAGLRHVALNCHALEASLAFYTEVMGMTVEWNPDPDNYYLTSGNDNLALHRAPAAAGAQRLDHIGFILSRIEDVDAWHAHLARHGVRIAQGPKTHRDGARSLYCLDPDDTTVQLIYHPPLAP